MRVPYFYGKARECLRMARKFARGSDARAWFVNQARNWRDLARDTRRVAGAAK
jgi:hypothetical protein